MKKAITFTGSTLAMMCICIFANAQEGTKSDTTQVEDFTIEEQNITLSVGESLQLHVNPSSANVRWFQGAWDLSANPILVVDQNGLITALKAGESYVAVESTVDGNVRKQAPVTVLNQGSVKTGNKQLEPTKECQWEEVKFTLTNNGSFIAQGVYYGSGAKSNQLNYLVTDQCIFMWFDIDYADSTKNFYPQPFTLEISDCNALAYNIYLNNSTQIVETSRSFASYAIKRGSSTGGTTQTDNILIKNDDGLIYDLNGHILISVPEKGSYIQNGKIFYNF